MSEGHKKIKIQPSQKKKMKDNDDGKPLDLSTKSSAKNKQRREDERQARKRAKRLVALLRQRNCNATNKMYDDVTMETAQTLLQLKSSVSPPESITETYQGNEACGSMPLLTTEICRENEAYRNIPRLMPEPGRGNEAYSMSRLIPEMRQGHDTCIKMSRLILETRGRNEASRNIPPLVSSRRHDACRGLPPLIPIPSRLNQPSTSSAKNHQILVQGGTQHASTSVSTFISPRKNKPDQQQVLRQQSVIMSPVSSNQPIDSTYMHQPMEVCNQEAHTSGAYLKNTSYQYPPTPREFWRPVPFPETRNPSSQTSKSPKVPISLDSRQAQQNLDTACALLSLSTSPAKVFESPRKKTSKRSYTEAQQSAMSTARLQYGPRLPSSRPSHRTHLGHPLNTSSSHASILSYDIDNSRRAQMAKSAASSDSTHQPAEQLNESQQWRTESTSMLRPPPYYSVNWKPQAPQTEARGIPQCPSDVQQRTIPNLGHPQRAISSTSLQKLQSLQFMNETRQQNSSQFLQSPATWLSRPPLYFMPLRCRPTFPQPAPPQFPPPAAAPGHPLQALRQYNNDTLMPNRPMWPRPNSFFPEQSLALSSHQAEIRAQPNEQPMLVQNSEDPDDPNNWDVDINKIMGVLQTVNFDLSDDDY